MNGQSKNSGVNYLADLWDGATASLVHQSRLPTPAPNTMIFVVVQRCNSRCNMCFIWENKNPPEVTVDEVHRIFERDREDFRSLRKLSLTGGEPSLRSDLPDLVEAVLRHTPSIKQLRLATHGMTPDRVIHQIEKVWAVAAKHAIAQFTVQVSIDGIGEIHDQIRGIKGGGARVQETLERLVEMRKNIPALGINISTVVQPINRDYVPDLQLLAQRFQVPIFFSPIVTSSDYYSNDSIAPSLSLTGDQAAQQTFASLAKTSTGSAKFYYQDMVGMLSGQARHRICMMGYHTCVLEADGNLHACVNSESLSFGNLLKERFRNIWWGKQAEDLRRRLHHEYCPTCPSMCYNKPVNIGEVANLFVDKITRQTSEQSTTTVDSSLI